MLHQQQQQYQAEQNWLQQQQMHQQQMLQQQQQYQAQQNFLQGSPMSFNQPVQFPSSVPGLISYPNVQSTASINNEGMPAPVPPIIRSTAPQLAHNVLPPPVAAAGLLAPPLPPPPPSQPTPSNRSQSNPSIASSSGCLLGVPYPMKPLFPSAASIRPPVAPSPAPIFGKPLETAANILPGGPRTLSFSIGGGMSGQAADAGNESELAARLESLQPLYDYLLRKMTAVMKRKNYSDAHINVSSVFKKYVPSLIADDCLIGSRCNAKFRVTCGPK
jgi:hypothetical protein